MTTFATRNRQRRSMKRISFILACLCALLLVSSCSGGDKQQMLRQLEELERMNRAYEPMTNDTLAQQLVDYFDRHGTSNERIRSYYILGCVYRDLDEAPRALDSYLAAIERADTTNKDCDYRTLIAINAQMSAIFHRQNLPQDEIRALNNVIRFTRMMGDSLNYINYQELLIKPYYLLGKTDTVLNIINNVNSLLMQRGHKQFPPLGVGTAAWINIERGQFTEAHRYLCMYEQDCNVVDSLGNVAKGWESYYWIKGFYELGINNSDSAELYFRKAMCFGDFNCSSNAYKGLISVYQRKRVIDSIAKYSRLHEEALDSLHNQMRTEAIHQATSLYDYSNFQRIAEQEAQKKREAWQLLRSLIAIAILLTVFSCFYYRKKRRIEFERLCQLDKALVVAKTELHIIKEEQEIFKKKDYDAVIDRNKKIEQELKLRIAELEKENNTKKEASATDNFNAFKCSKIVGVFSKKALFTKEHPIPNKAEWAALENQFINDMPATYRMLNKNKKLSSLELNTCILLLLDYEESTIVGLTGTSSQSVSIAKRRANMKIFNEKSAVTLKYYLKRLIKHY